MKREPRITHSELAAAIEEANSMIRSDVLPVPPPGFFSVRQYSDQVGVQMRQARAEIDRLAAQGKLERVRAYSGRHVTIFYGKPRANGNKV